jgi:hypothetical protein
MKINNYMNGSEVNTPLNILDLEIELNFDKSSVKQTVSLNNLEFGVNDPRFVTDAYKSIKQHENSNVGVIEGLPYILEIDNEKGKKYDLIKGFLDVWGKEQTRNERGDVIKVNVYEQGKIDWLNDVSDSVSFEFLYNQGKITQYDFVQIPYCIDRKQNTIEIIFTLFAFFYLIDKIKTETNVLIELLIQASEGTSAAIIVAIIYRITSITVYLITLGSIVIDLYNYLIQPVKFHTGMSVLKMFEKGCEHFGLQFRSSILQQEPFNKLYWLPEKFAINERNTVQGLTGNLTSSNTFSNTGFYDGTFGDFIRLWQQVFNAKLLIINDVLYFEKFDYNPSTNNWVIPNLLDSKFNYSYNKDDFYSNIKIGFNYDLNDKHTVQEWKGTNVQVIQNAITVNNSRMNLAKNYLEIKHPFALGKTKKDFSTLETIYLNLFKALDSALNILINTINTVLDVINSIIRLVNKIIKLFKVIGINIKLQLPRLPMVPKSNLKNLIENRLGMLKMESDYVQVPKAILLDVASNSRNTKVNTSNDSILNAKYLWDNYNYFISFVPKESFKGNQYKLRELSQCKFSFSDYEQIRGNNLVTDAYGNECEILTLKYNPLLETVTGTYRERFNYLQNIKETIIEPNGI